MSADQRRDTACLKNENAALLNLSQTVEKFDIHTYNHTISFDTAVLFSTQAKVGFTQLQADEQVKWDPSL